MSWWLPHHFDAKRPYLQARGRILRAVREWFDLAEFDEVQTPVLQVCPVMDAHIHGFQTSLKGPDLSVLRDMYLHTSPEFAMKKLLVAGCESIYQIAPVFRNGDQSRLHSPEFTLLEWYRAGTHYAAMMDDTVALLRHVATAIDVRECRFDGRVCDVFADWQKISVREAFDYYAGIDLDRYLDDVEGFRAQVRAVTGHAAPDDGWDDLFFRVMADKIEPHLGQGTATILYDYPVCMASLARRSPDDERYAERFEVYVCGVELANAFSELTDADEQRARFETEMAHKQALYGERYPLDEEFLAALAHGMPPSSGNALGLDRLVMVMSGAQHIDQVLWAPVEI